jgi:dGTP triphosphohydrolase
VEDDHFIFPPYFREKLQQATNESERLRTVADYVASLSESQAINLNQRLTGQALGSGFERLL